MASVEDHHPVYNNDEDLDDDDDDEESEDVHNNNPPLNDVVIDEEDDDVDVDDDDDSPSSSSNHHRDPPPPPSSSVAGGEVTVAVVPATPDPLRHRIDDFAVTVANKTTVVEEKKPSAAFDESRKLFQRLWTDEDEIELLQGFLDYTSQRGGFNNSSHHHDTTAFYDQIKSKLQLDFNKNQLVEKLRRLKKKYRNVMSKMDAGKDIVFKSGHDHATFEISRKIWSSVGSINRGGGGSVGLAVAPLDDGGYDDEDAHFNHNSNFVDHSPNFNLNANPNGIDVKTPRSRKRPRGPIKVDEKHGFVQQQYFQPLNLPRAPPHVPIQLASPPAIATPTPIATPTTAVAATSSIPSLIEETVKSCLSPIFKELLNNVMNMNSSKGLGMGMALSPIPLGFGGGVLSPEMMADEKWRKQQMLELEVYSRRLDLVQDQIKAQLEELRSMGS